MTILVTGAGGWLGRRLTQKLTSAGHEVRALALPGEESSAVFRGDLRNPADCAAFCKDAAGALLIHTAGIIHPRRIRDLYEVNVEGTRNLLKAATEAGLKRAVVVSSNSPVGVNPHPGHLFDETSPYHPYMNYGRSKMQMELAVREFEHIEKVVVRPPWFYGPGQPARQTLFFSMIRTGKVPIVGSGENLRSMAYIDNLCDGLMLAATVERARGQTYWIADRRPYSMNEIVDTVERLLESEFHLSVAHKRLRLPSIASEVALVADGTLQAMGLYNQKIHVLSEMNKNIACSVERAIQELGYDPQVSLEEGMRCSIADCLQRGIRI